MVAGHFENDHKGISSGLNDTGKYQPCRGGCKCMLVPKEPTVLPKPAPTANMARGPPGMPDIIDENLRATAMKKNKE